MRKAVLKWLILGLAIVVVLALVIGSFFVRKIDQTSGTDLRLTAIEGSVELNDSEGETFSVQEGMRLHSGDILSTGSQSYAYVTLDNTKVVKLDASTQVQIVKDGRHLDLTVSVGKLFFNVISISLYSFGLIISSFSSSTLA